MTKITLKSSARASFGVPRWTEPRQSRHEPVPLVLAGLCYGLGWTMLFYLLASAVR